MKDENSNKKAFWTIGIALIIFLILVLGSVIGLKLTRDKINNNIDDLGYQEFDDDNFEINDDGKKENNSDLILGEQFETDGLIFSNFKIVSTDEVSTISVDIENTLETKSEEKTILVSFIDNHEKDMTDEISITAPAGIEAKEKTTLVISIPDDVSNARKIEIRVFGEDYSGDNEIEEIGVTSGDVISGDVLENSGEIE